MDFKHYIPHNNRMLNHLSLKTRVNLIIAAILALIVLIGSVLVIRHVRDSVERETRSALQLALEMVESARLQGPMSGAQTGAWMAMLKRLSHSRHVRLHVLHGDHSTPPFPPSRIPGVPEWFAAMVRPPDMMVEQRIPTRDDRQIRVELVADPGDEIAEAWEETQVFLGLILLLAGSCFAALYWILGRAFQPVDAVLEGLVALEQGKYDYRLPDFPQPEWNQIAAAFNHCAWVLEQARTDNRSLTRQLLKVEEDERRTLARELHDELGQVLSAIKMMALSIKQQRQPEQSVKAACLISDHVDHLFDIIHSMIHKLRPLMLDDLGLSAAIVTLVNGWRTRRPDVDIHFHCPQNVDGFPTDQQIHVYRIIQESLTNAFKHANAKAIDLGLDIVSYEVPTLRWLKITVGDDGRGVDLCTGTGFGLKGMRERVESLGGRFDCTTAPGQGFHLSILIPFEEEHTDDRPRHACG